MADSVSEHLIRIVVQGVKGLGSVVERGTKAVERHTSAIDKQSAAVERGARSASDAQREYEEFAKAVRDGEKDYDSARFGLQRLAAEFDRLARKEKVGSGLSEDLHRSAVEARALIEQLKTAMETERRVAEEDVQERVRRERERQKSLVDLVKAEQATEAQGARNRKTLLAEVLDEVRRDHDERERFATELADHEIKESARVEASRAASRAERAQPALREVGPSLLQRVRRVFSRDDEGGARKFVEDLEDVDRSSRSASTGVSRLERVIGKLSGTSHDSALSLARVDNTLSGLRVEAVVAFSQELISALVALASAALAVASAAAQAGAAIGGAFIAAAGQSIPTIGLLIAAFGRIGAVFDAVDLFNKQAARSGYDQAQAADAQADAADRVASAQEQVASAARRVEDATEALTDARERARRKIEDLSLAEREASLSSFEAATALSRAVAAGDVGALEGLRLRRDQSSLDASRASSDASSARQAGVEGSDEVQAAIEDIAEANVALRRARRELEAARRAAARALTQGSAADRSLAQALAQLTPAELALYESVKRIQARFRKLFRPVTDIIVLAFKDGVDRASRVLGDPRVVGTATKVAGAIAAAIRRVGRGLTSGPALDFFKTMGDEAARNIPLLTTLAAKVGKITAALAVASGPALRRFIEFFVDLADKGEKATGSRSGMARLQRFFLRGEEMAESFLKLGGAIIGLFAALAGAGGAETGADLVDDLTHSIITATNWVREHQEEVKAFFKDTADSARIIGGVIFSISKAIIGLFQSEKIEAFADAFRKVLLPALVTVSSSLGAITFLISKLVSLPGVSQITQIALSIGLLFGSFRVFGRLLSTFSVGLARVFGGLRLLGPLFFRAALLVNAAGHIAMGPWGLLIAAIVTGIVLLDKKFHFIRPTIKFLGELFKTVFGAIKSAASDVVPPVARLVGVVLAGAFNAVRKVVIAYVDVWAGFLTMMLGGLSTLASVGSKLPFIGDKFKGLADFIDGAREKIDGYREALRGLGREHDRAPAKIERLRAQVDKLKARLARLKEGSDEYRATAERLRRKQVQLNEAMAEADDKGKEGAKGPRAIGRSAGSAASSVGRANKAITDNYNNLMTQLGNLKPLTFKEMGSSFLAGATAGALDGKEAGGWVGRRGRQGPDKRLILTGDGEAVLAVPHQRPVEEGLALRSMLLGGGPSTLDQLFSRVKGYVGAFASGGRVNFGGHPTNVNPHVRSLIGLLQRRFPLSVTSTTDHSLRTTSGNISDHPAGNAVDLASTTRVMYQVAEYIKSSGLYRFLKQGIHNPNLAVDDGRLQRPPGQFAGAVWEQHADHLHLAIVRAIGKVVGGVSGALKRLRTPRITGPSGRVKEMAQRVVDRVARAARRRVERAEQATLGASARPRRATDAVGNIMEIARHAAYVNRVKWDPSIVRVLLSKESGGGRNLGPSGSLSATGPFQVIPGTFAAYALPGHRDIRNAYDNALAAFAYIRSRYKTLANLARVTGLLGAGYHGYEAGGSVAGTGPQLAEVHGGEHVLTRQEVERAGGHKVIYAMRRLLGGGTQGSRGSYELGGRTLQVGDSLGVGTEPYLRKLVKGLVADNRGGRASPEALKVLQRLLTRGVGRVVFDIGTNDSSASIFSRSLKRLERIVGDQRQLVISRLHGPGAAAKNVVLERFAAANSNVVVASPSLRGLAPDGIHFTASGYAARARSVARSIRGTPDGSASSSGYSLPTVFDTSLDGVLRELGRARRAISRLKTRGEKFATRFGRSIGLIADDGGLLDQGSDALQRLVDGAARRVKQLAYRVTSSGLVVRRMSAQEQAAAQIPGLDRQLAGQRDLRSAATSSLDDVDERLSAIRRGGVTSGERKAYETLVAARRKLVSRIEALDGQIADTIEARFQAQEQVLQGAVDQVNQQAQRGLARADLSDRLASLTEGVVGGQRQAFAMRARSLSQRAEILRTQRAGLLPVLGEAQRQGNDELARDLVAQIEELNVAIAENTSAVAQNSVAYRQSEVDAASRRAGRVSAALDLADRTAGLAEAAGDSAGAFALRGSVLLGRRAAISAQRDSLLGLLESARASFGGTVAEQQQIEDLSDQIAELGLQLDENTRAVESNTTLARQAAIDAITGRGSFLGGVLGGLSGIVRSIGQLAGSEDVERLRALAEAAGAVLQQTGAGLRQKLLEGFGVDLRGLSPDDLVDALRALDFDSIESGMSVDQRQQFESLIQAIIDNASAVVDNTEQLKTANGEGGLQSWSTTAWQLLREAIFDGAGGLARYNLPAPMLPATTTSFLARPPGVAPSPGDGSGTNRGGDTTINVSVENPGPALDPEWIGEVIATRAPLARAR